MSLVFVHGNYVVLILLQSMLLHAASVLHTTGMAYVTSKPLLYHQYHFCDTGRVLHFSMQVEDNRDGGS